MDKLPERIRIKDIARLANVSVGTVDRVLHGRPGVSQNSRERVENILEELDYKPNMYASALASNKKYHYLCLLPQHKEGSYWCDIEKGIKHAGVTFSDFHISIDILYYDPYDYVTFEECGRKIIEAIPDGVMMAPTLPSVTIEFVDKLNIKEIPYVFVDSYIPNLNPLAFFGQNSVQSGYFAGSMLMLLAREEHEVVVFRHIYGGRIGSNQQKNREIGFRKYMHEHYPDCCILELDVDIKKGAEEELKQFEDFFAKHPNVKSGVTFNSQVYILGEYIESKHNSHFNLVGYDLLERNVDCLRKGVVSFLIAQQPFFQGYNSILSLCRHLILRKGIKQINYMPIDLLSAENIDYYLEAQE